MRAARLLRAPSASRTGTYWGTVERGTSPHPRESPMSNHTYRVTEIVGTSTESIDQAIRNGIARAGQTVRNLDWFEVSQVRGHIENGEVAHFQVGLKVGFRLDGED